MQIFLMHNSLLGCSTIGSVGGFDHRKLGPVGVTGWSSHLHFCMPHFPSHPRYNHLLAQVFWVLLANQKYFHYSDSTGGICHRYTRSSDGL